MNKKAIGIIIAVVFVLLVGIVGGTDQSEANDITTTQSLNVLLGESSDLTEGISSDYTQSHSSAVTDEPA